MELEEVGGGSAGSGEASLAPPPAIWSEPSAADQTAAILAESPADGAFAARRLVVSPAGRSFQHRPRLTRFAGSHLVVWQAAGLDGSLDGVFGAIVSPTLDAEPIPFKINDYTEHDQREPAVAGGFRDQALVVWSSFGQDGDQGGIYGRLLRLDEETPLADEVQIAETTAGHQHHPRVAADPGGYWVAWETSEADLQVTRLSLRRLDHRGRPVSREIHVAAPFGEQLRLAALDGPGASGVRLRWWRLDRRGRFLGLASQQANGQGPAGPITWETGSEP